MLIGRCMPSWTLWLFLVALLVLPVLLRLYVGDDEPDNAITHEQESAPGQDPDDTLAVVA